MLTARREKTMKRGRLQQLYHEKESEAKRTKKNWI
jgi:hypothetical protein